MSRSQRLSPAEARRFRTGRRCLNFAHTGGDGPLAAFELLHDLDDARTWLAHLLDVDQIRSDGTQLSDVIALRRAIWTTASRAAAGERSRASDRAVLNRAARRPSLVPELSPSDEARTASGPTVSQALSTLARDAIDLFGGPLAGRVRVCAASDCGLLFVDQSRPGVRRWCSMQRCGNLAKVRSHRARNAAQTDAGAGPA